MEYGLRVDHLVSVIGHEDVLILVLMEYGLRGLKKTYDDTGSCSLNPCFNGIWSARVKSVKICM